MQNDIASHTGTTPSPWRMEPPDGDGHVRVVDVQDVTVARFYQQPLDTWSALDNAKASVKAPELHALLQTIVEKFGSDIDEDEPISGSDAVDFLVGFVEEARRVLGE
jgi:hypothetical protein